MSKFQRQATTDVIKLQDDDKATEYRSLQLAVSLVAGTIAAPNSQDETVRRLDGEVYLTVPLTGNREAENRARDDAKVQPGRRRMRWKASSGGDRGQRDLQDYRRSSATGNR